MDEWPDESIDESMDEAEARARLAAAPVARLATVRPDGAPHIVPVVFAVRGDRVVTPVDHKPKRTTDLQRLRNVAHQPRVSLLVDHYDRDWQRLWWVRVDAIATVLDTIPERWVEELAGKYPQYRDRPPGGRAVEMTIDRVRYWSAG